MYASCFSEQSVLVRPFTHDHEKLGHRHPCTFVKQQIQQHKSAFRLGFSPSDELIDLSVPLGPLRPDGISHLLRRLSILIASGTIDGVQSGLDLSFEGGGGAFDDLPGPRGWRLADTKAETVLDELDTDFEVADLRR